MFYHSTLKTLNFITYKKKNFVLWKYKNSQNTLKVVPCIDDSNIKYG